jgi:hypothetical protein
VTSSIGLLLLLLLCAAVLVWLLRRPRHPERAEPTSNDTIDRETLAEAEEEVKDLNTFLSPEDAEEDLPDWGPGAPKG